MSTTHFNEMANQWDTPEAMARSEVFAGAIRPLLPPGSAARVMELGCGTGLLSFQLLARAQSILGVDTSDGMLAAFDRKAAGHPNVASRLVDLETEPLGDHPPFDLVASTMAFHHLNHPGAMVKRLKGMLAPGGKLAVVDLEEEDGTFHPDNVKMGVKHFGFSRQTLAAWAQDAGFGAPEVSTIHAMEKNGRAYPLFLAVLRA